MNKAVYEVWYAKGQGGFAAGLPAAPALNQVVMDAVIVGAVGLNVSMFKGWADGWHHAAGKAALEHAKNAANK